MSVLIKLEAATPSLPPFFIQEPGLAFKMNLHKVMINAGFKYQPKKNRMYVSHQFLHKDGRVVDYNLKTNGWAYDDCGGRGLVLRIINTMTYSRDVFAAPACYLAQRGGGCWDAKEKSVRNCAVSRGAA